MAFNKAEHTHASDSASEHFKVGLMRGLMQAAYTAPGTGSDTGQTETTSTLAVDA
jgi:hypothetical protein